MKIRKNDKVKIIKGKDKGKTGNVLKVLLEENKLIVEGINLAKRHVKPGAVSKEGGIISIEKPLPTSNVVLIDPKTNEPTKIGYKIIEGKKYRISKKTKEVIDLKK